MRKHRAGPRGPFNPDVAAWRIIIAAVTFLLYCLARNLWNKH